MLVKAAVNIEAEYNAHSPWNCSPTAAGIFDIRSEGLVMTSSIRKFLLSKISTFSVSKSPRCLFAIQDQIAFPTPNASRNGYSIIGYNEDSNAHTSTWNNNTSKTLDVTDDNKTYYVEESVKLINEKVNKRFFLIGQRQVPAIHELEIGRQVTVLYNPNKPKKAYIKENIGHINC